MAEPHSRQSLILATFERHDKLDQILSDMSDEELNGTFPFKGRDRNVRDVLVQLAACKKNVPGLEQSKPGWDRKAFHAETL
ncbi:ClbS/DfsB family four-helix bundle protein [Lacticaseibacillus camelliae]|uniref:ClbS/DfsB family four-helix bundle protein n=1 Tax=Lacticaseibacillus camelliae TaxID=381742 RepID=UPI0006D0C07F|nr:ClbS/DfsB family four-helix bundle protein [Lacticaseibacillus camelliae]